MRIIRQVLLMIKEEKLFSAIHIAGTAMAIAFTMVMAVVYYIKLAPIYPEVNRMRTVYFDGMNISGYIDEKLAAGTTRSFSGKAMKEWFLTSKNIEYCAPTTLGNTGRGKILNRKGCFVLKGKDEHIDVIPNHTNADYFKIYQYEFLEGRPLTKHEVENMEHVCVISDDLRDKYFGKGQSAVGKMIQTEFYGKVRVVGVIRGASRLTPDSYTNIIMPYTLEDYNWDNHPYQGDFGLIVTIKDNKHLQNLVRELNEIARRLNSSGMIHVDHWGIDGITSSKVELTNMLETHPMHMLRQACTKEHWSYEFTTNWQIVKHFAGILFILLFVPALNLCGIVAGRMERRTAEMAVRKTFGARRRTLLNQVITENLVLTSIGGIIGLAISWFAIYGMRTEVLSLFFDISLVDSTTTVTGEMLFAPLLFVGAFIAVLVLNLLSALIPAWLSLRKPIVESMMEKR